MTHSRLLPLDGSKLNLNRPRLVAEATDPVGYRPFVDPKTRRPFLRWLTKSVNHDSNLYTSGVFKYLTKAIGTEDCRPRFYQQLPGLTLPAHRDRGTLCSINIVLNPESAEYILFDSFKIQYEAALLNVQHLHAVPSSNTPRLLLKLSIFDISYTDAAVGLIKAGYSTTRLQAHALTPQDVALFPKQS